jgi:hypothetical protein
MGSHPKLDRDIEKVTMGHISEGWQNTLQLPLIFFSSTHTNSKQNPPKKSKKRYNYVLETPLKFGG